MRINKILLLLIMACVALALVACGESAPAGCDHEWVDATCTEPRSCKICHEMMGDPLGHKGGDATCTTKAVSEICRNVFVVIFGKLW